jgi:hypothetical protein
VCGVADAVSVGVGAAVVGVVVASGAGVPCVGAGVVGVLGVVDEVVVVEGVVVRMSIPQPLQIDTIVVVRVYDVAC